MGTDHVLTDADLRRSYEIDWTGAYRGVAAIVVRPATTGEVAAVLERCNTAGVPVVAQGGNTGLVGGSIPDDAGTAVVLSTTRLLDLDPIESGAARVTVGAGVSLGALQIHARASGFDFGVDLAARDSATIGGMVATNAGGVRVLRYGTMRRQVLGVEAALASGEVLSHLVGAEKDNTGYDVAGLLCGSEGTLGIITRVCLRLVPLLPHRVTALLAWPDLETAVAGLRILRDGVSGLDAAEYIVRRGVDLVRAELSVPDPFPRPYPVYLLVEAAGTTDPTAELAATIELLVGLLDAAVADSEKQRRALWSLRELHTEALSRVGPPRKYDVSVPIDRLPAFVREVVATVEADGGLTCHHFGHLGDGNVHVNVLGDGSAHVNGLGDGSAHVNGLGSGQEADTIYELVARYGGSISAEHGIGRLKRPWLHLSRSPAELRTFGAIKHALDPRGILNPGVLLQGPTL